MAVSTNTSDTDLNQREPNHFDLIEITKPMLPYERNINGFGNSHFLKLTGLNNKNYYESSESVWIRFLFENNSHAANIKVPYWNRGELSIAIKSKGDMLQVNEVDGTISRTPIYNSNMVVKLIITSCSSFNISKIVLTPSTNIAIIPHNLPIRKMSEDIVGKLQTAILESIKQISDQKDDLRGFDEFTYINGYLKIICASVDTGIWLEKFLKALPLWNSEKLQIVNLNEVPIEKKCSFYLQGQKMKTDTLLQTISAQNLVHLNSLDVLDVESDNNGTKYHLIMDMVTWDQLNGHIYYGLSRIPLQEYVENENIKTESRYESYLD